MLTAYRQYANVNVSEYDTWQFYVLKIIVHLSRVSYG